MRVLTCVHRCVDGFITLLFTIDLCVNLFANSANYFHDFFTNPASLFGS